MTLSSSLIGGLMALSALFTPHSPLFGTTIAITQQGGTGTSSPSGILYGDNGATTHLNTVTVGSGLTFSGGTLSNTVTGTVTSISTSLPITGGTITTTGTIACPTCSTFAYPFPSNATTTSLAFNGGMVIGGTSNQALTNNVALDYLNPNFRISLPSTESYYWYNQGRGTHLLMYMNGSNGVLQLADYTGGFAGMNGSGVIYNFATSTIKTSQLTNDSGFTNFAYPFTPITNWGTTFAAGTTSQMYINNAGFPSFFAVNASSTNASMTTFAVGGSATTTIDATSKMTGVDTNNSYTGIVSPTVRLVLGSGTTTTWTASTTNTAYSPFVVAPFAGTVKQVRCITDASFLGVNIQVNGSNITPSYFVASTTVGVISFTAGNTFTAGQKILANFGTTTSASTLEINCTLDVVQTS